MIQNHGKFVKFVAIDTNSNMLLIVICDATETKDRIHASKLNLGVLLRTRFFFIALSSKVALIIQLETI